jgi:hypothetical protein
MLRRFILIIIIALNIFFSSSCFFTRFQWNFPLLTFQKQKKSGVISPLFETFDITVDKYLKNQSLPIPFPQNEMEFKYLSLVLEDKRASYIVLQTYS